MKKILFLLLIAALGIIQLTILDYFKIFGVKPDLLLICMGFASLFFELRWSLIFSVFAGIFKDAFGISTFGINTLLFPFWALLIIRLNKEITIDYNFIRMVLIFIVSLLHNTATWLIFIYLGNIVAIGIFLRIASVGALYTALVSPLIFKIGARIISSTYPAGLKHSSFS